jgi:LysR family transcriptional regulator for metE and metH
MRHLLMIAAVARHRNLSLAARELGVSPSALSHRLAEAERRLGARLFDRSGRSVTLTPAGDTIQRVSQKVVAMVAQAESDVGWLAGDVEQTLRVCVGYYNTYDWFLPFLGRWRAAYPETHVCIVSDAKQKSLEVLRDGAIDLCILPFKPQDHDLDTRALFADELVLLVPPSSMLTEKGYVEGGHLASLDFLTYTRLVVPDQEYERFLKPENARPARFVDVEVPEIIPDMIAEGFGVSILSRWAMRKWIDGKQVEALRVSKNGLPITWYAVVRKGGPETETAQLLAEALSRYFAGPEASKNFL